MTESDFSWPRIIGYGSSPSRCGPPHKAPTDTTAASHEISQVPGDPFARDVAFDPGGTTMPRIAALHMLPSSE